MLSGCNYCWLLTTLFHKSAYINTVQRGLKQIINASVKNPSKVWTHLPVQTKWYCHRICGFSVGTIRYHANFSLTHNETEREREKFPKERDAFEKVLCSSEVTHMSLPRRDALWSAPQWEAQGSFSSVGSGCRCRPEWQPLHRSARQSNTCPSAVSANRRWWLQVVDTRGGVSHTLRTRRTGSATLDWGWWEQSLMYRRSKVTFFFTLRSAEKLGCFEGVALQAELVKSDQHGSHSISAQC